MATPRPALSPWVCCAGAQNPTDVDDFVPTLVPNKHLLLDHILLSPGLHRTSGLRRVPNSGTVHHAEYQAQVMNNGTHREGRPSDHRPVSVQLRY
jgi:hypothetical protein